MTPAAMSGPAGPTICHKTDEKDVVLIARLTAKLRRHIPEPVDETSGRLRRARTA
jgi:hypothetical protein